MPRRKRGGWSPPKVLPGKDNPNYMRLLALPRGHILRDRATGKRYLEHSRAGSVYFEEYEKDGRKHRRIMAEQELHAQFEKEGEPIAHDYQQAFTHLTNDHFSPEESRNLNDVVTRILDPFQREYPLRVILAKGAIPLPQSTSQSRRPHELYELGSKMEALAKVAVDEPRFSRRLNEAAQLLYRMFIASMVYRDIHAMGIKASMLDAYRQTEKVIGVPLTNEWVKSAQNLEATRQRIEHDLILDRRKDRQNQARRIAARAELIYGKLTPAQEIGKPHTRQSRGGGLVTFAQEEIANIPMRAGARKKIYREFAEELIALKHEPTGDEIRAALFHARRSAFRASRLAAREHLARLGFAADAVFDTLHVGKYHTSNDVNFPPEAIDRLNELHQVLKQNGSQNTARVIDDIRGLMDKYSPRQTVKSAPTSTLLPVERPAPAHNARKAAEKERRKQRRAGKEEPQRPAVAPAAPLPPTLEGAVAQATKDARISGRMYGHLRDLLHQAKPVAANNRAIIDGLKIMILCIRVSNYGIKGRVEPDVLRKKSTPQHLHVQFDKALGELIHERKLRYELHGNKNNYVTLDPSYAATALGKFDFRRSDEYKH